MLCVIKLYMNYLNTGVKTYTLIQFNAFLYSLFYKYIIKIMTVLLLTDPIHVDNSFRLQNIGIPCSDSNTGGLKYRI